MNVSYSQKYSAFINEAYSTLRDEISRAEYVVCEEAKIAAIARVCDQRKLGPERPGIYGGNSGEATEDLGKD